MIEKLLDLRDQAGLLAPTAFANWLSSRIANDRKHGRKVYRYHPRSDEHSKKLCALVLGDLQSVCPALAKDIETGVVVGGINAQVKFASGKIKALDLAIGEPAPGESDTLKLIGTDTDVKIGRVRIACEAKQCMTEHGKTKPRLFDELSSSHEIIHQGEPAAIAAGLVVVNIAPRFASPLRQEAPPAEVVFTKHNQPHVTQDMVSHLRGLTRRSTPNGVGFDAFSAILVDCDNVGPCALYSGPAAPQVGDADEYRTFLLTLARL